MYGSDAPRVIALFRERPEWNQLLHPSLPYRSGEVIWLRGTGLRRSVEDVLARRTRSLFLDARAARTARSGCRSPGGGTRQGTGVAGSAGRGFPETGGRLSGRPGSVWYAIVTSRSTPRGRGSMNSAIVERDAVTPHSPTRCQRLRLLDQYRISNFPSRSWGEARATGIPYLRGSACSPSILPNEHAASMCMVERLDPSLDEIDETAPPCLTAERSGRHGPMGSSARRILGLHGSSIPIQTSSASTNRDSLSVSSSRDIIPESRLRKEKKWGELLELLEQLGSRRSRGDSVMKTGADVLVDGLSIGE